MEKWIIFIIILIFIVAVVRIIINKREKNLTDVFGRKSHSSYKNYKEDFSYKEEVKKENKKFQQRDIFQKNQKEKIKSQKINKDFEELKKRFEKKEDVKKPDVNKNKKQIILNLIILTAFINFLWIIIVAFAPELYGKISEIVFHNLNINIVLKMFPSRNEVNILYILIFIYALLKNMKREAVAVLLLTFVLPKISATPLIIFLITVVKWNIIIKIFKENFLIKISGFLISANIFLNTVLVYVIKADDFGNIFLFMVTVGGFLMAVHFLTLMLGCMVEKSKI